MRNGKFLKGTSGNPGGRPKIPEEIKELFENAGPQAAAALINLLESKDERVRLKAATELLDRAIGRPVQGVDMSFEDISVPFDPAKALAQFCAIAVEVIEEELLPQNR